jgi:transcriptional regulator with XRE-family HTH domain
MTTDRNNRITALRMSVGRAIAAARRARGMRQSDVAAQLGVEQETISRFERGTTLLPLDRLMDLAVLFEVPVGAFFAGTPGPAAPQFEELVNLLGLLSEPEQNLVVAQAISLTKAVAGLRFDDKLKTDKN